MKGSIRAVRNRMAVWNGFTGSYSRTWPRPPLTIRRISPKGDLKFGGERTFLSEVLAYETVGLRPVDDGLFEVLHRHLPSVEILRSVVKGITTNSVVIVKCQ